MELLKNKILSIKTLPLEAVLNGLLDLVESIGLYNSKFIYNFFFNPIYLYENFNSK